MRLLVAKLPAGSMHIWSRLDLQACIAGALSSGLQLLRCKHGIRLVLAIALPHGSRCGCATLGNVKRYATTAAPAASRTSACSHGSLCSEQQRQLDDVFTFDGQEGTVDRAEAQHACRKAADQYPEMQHDQ